MRRVRILRRLRRLRRRLRRRTNGTSENENRVTQENRSCNIVTNGRFKKWVRRWKEGLTRVAVSSIPNAGKGLWANQQFLPGDRIARASGKILSEMERATSDSSGILQIKEGTYMDTEGPKCWEGKYINDGPHSGRRANVKIEDKIRTCRMTNRKWVYVIAIEKINLGDELLLDYGEQYGWDDDDGGNDVLASARL